MATLGEYSELPLPLFEFSVHFISRPPAKSTTSSLRYRVPSFFQRIEVKPTAHFLGASCRPLGVPALSLAASRLAWPLFLQLTALADSKHFPNRSKCNTFGQICALRVLCMMRARGVVRSRFSCVIDLNKIKQRSHKTLYRPEAWWGFRTLHSNLRGKLSCHVGSYKIHIMHDRGSLVFMREQQKTTSSVSTCMNSVFVETKTNRETGSIKRYYTGRRHGTETGVQNGKQGAG